MNAAKITRMMKVESVVNMSDATWRYMCQAMQDESVIDAEAKNLANVMTGQAGWQGVQPEKRHFSGLARKANAYLATTVTTFRITEHAYGDGMSWYTLR